MLLTILHVYSFLGRALLDRALCPELFEVECHVTGIIPDAFLSMSQTVRALICRMTAVALLTTRRHARLQ
jgi:hypothetical protein